MWPALSFLLALIVATLSFAVWKTRKTVRASLSDSLRGDTVNREPADLRRRRFYETILASTPDFVYVFGLDYRLLYANHALLTMWGVTRESYIGRSFLELGYEPWHAEMHEREIDTVIATRQPLRGIVPFNGTHGRRQYEYIFVPIIGAQGDVEAVAGTTRDVTEQLLSEERLKASEEQQSFLVELADTIRPLTDPLEVQAETSRMLGQHLHANRVTYFEVHGGDFVIEKDFSDGVQPLRGRYPIMAFGDSVLDKLEAGQTAVVTDLHRNESISREEVNAFDQIHTRAFVTVPLVRNGAFVSGLAVQSAHAREWSASDLSIIEETAQRTWASIDRARTELALRSSEELFRSLFTTMAEGFCIIDMQLDEHGQAVDFRFEAMNPAFDAHTGLGAVLGQSVRRVVPELEQSWFDIYGRVVRTGEPVRFVEQAKAISGRWFDVSAFRLGDEASHRVAILFTDITPRMEAQAERERLVSQLREQDRRKDEFLATLAHELRNPLAPIRNGLQLIRLTDTTGNVEQARAMMERQVGQLVRLVDDLLDASRVTTGKLELRRERVDLQSVIRAELDTLNSMFVQAGLALTADLPRSAVEIDGDPIRLAQIVSNLLTNAIKYTPRGGSVHVSLESDGAMARLSVRDTGIGIPANMLEAVFEMFTQVDRTIEKTSGGLGIGLSLVKWLVEMHGGEISAHSDGEERGSRFDVELPVATSAVCPLEIRIHRNGNAPQSATPRRVVLIDDNKDAAESLAKVLTLHGHVVRTAFDGEQGLALVEQERPDLVLCDIGMPRLNGFETARRIRREQWGEALVLVALTGWGQFDDRQRSAAAGFDLHLVKPVDTDVLLQLLDGVQTTTTTRDQTAIERN